MVCRRCVRVRVKWAAIVLSSVGLMALLLTVAGVGLSEAQDGPSLVMTLDAGFDGYFRDGEWFPVRVTLSNNGPDLVGTLAVHPTGDTYMVTFVVPVELPSRSHKKITVGVSFDGSVRELSADLIVDGEVLISASDPVSPLWDADVFCLVLGHREGTAFDLMGVWGDRWNVYQATVPPEGMPDSAAELRSADVIFVRDADTGELTETQRNALADWVLSGGHLIVTGGNGWRANVAGLGDLMPVDVSGLAEIDVSPMAWFAGGDVPLEGESQVAAGDLVEGAQALLVTDDDVVLLARREYGSGIVDYLAVDPASGILRHWDGWDGFWFSLLMITGPRMPWADGFQYETEALSNADIVPFVDLLSARQFCLLGLLYALLVGPGAYILLKRLGRLDWGWVIIPVVALLFALALYVAGVAMEAFKPIMGRMDVVLSWPDSRHARVDGVLGVWGADMGSYDVGFEPGISVRPLLPGAPNPLVDRLNVTVLEVGDSFRMTGVPSLTTYSIGMEATGYLDTLYLDGEAKLGVGFSSVEASGWVTNTTNMNFDDCYALILDSSYRIGALAAGEKAEFSLRATADVPIPSRYGAFGESESFTVVASHTGVAFQWNSTSVSYPDLLTDSQVMFISSPEGRETARRYSLVQALTGNSEVLWDGNVYVMCWVQRPPFEALVDDATPRLAATTLVISQLRTTLDVGPRSGVIPVPIGMMRWSPGRAAGAVRTTPMTGSAGNIMTDDDVLTFRFSPLDVVNLPEVTSVILDLEGSGDSSPVIDLWSWEAGEWVEVGGGWGRLVVTEPDEFVGPGDAVEVRVRVGSQDDSFIVDRITVSLRGYGNEASPGAAVLYEGGGDS